MHMGSLAVVGELTRSICRKEPNQYAFRGGIGQTPGFGTVWVGDGAGAVEHVQAKILESALHSKRHGRDDSGIDTGLTRSGNHCIFELFEVGDGGQCDLIPGGNFCKG